MLFSQRGRDRGSGCQNGHCCRRNSSGDLDSRGRFGSSEPRHQVLAVIFLDGVQDRSARRQQLTPGDWLRTTESAVSLRSPPSLPLKHRERGRPLLLSYSGCQIVRINSNEVVFCELSAILFICKLINLIEKFVSIGSAHSRCSRPEFGRVKPYADRVFGVHALPLRARTANSCGQSRKVERVCRSLTPATNLSLGTRSVKCTKSKHPLQGKIRRLLIASSRQCHYPVLF